VGRMDWGLVDGVLPPILSDGSGFTTVPPILSDGSGFTTVKEETWDIRVVVVVDSAGHGRCTRRFAQNARKNAKSLLNPEKTARYTARNAIQSARTKAVKRIDFVRPFL